MLLRQPSKYNQTSKARQMKKSKHPFTARASSAYKLLAGMQGVWSASDEAKLSEALQKKADAQAGKKSEAGRAISWTAKMQSDLDALQAKKVAPKSLGQGAKTYVTEVWMWKRFGFKLLDVDTKQTVKGTKTETEGIALMEQLRPLPEMRFKNNERKIDEWFTGEADVVTANLIEDNKSSFTLKQFLDADLQDKGYLTQIQVYCYLYGCERGGLWYTLNDSPRSVIEGEIKRAGYQLGWDAIEGDPTTADEYDEQCRQIEHNHTPSLWLPAKDRAKVAYFDFDAKVIEDLKDAVELARTFYDSLSVGAIEYQPWK